MDTRKEFMMTDNIPSLREIDFRKTIEQKQIQEMQAERIELVAELRTHQELLQSAVKERDVLLVALKNLVYTIEAWNNDVQAVIGRVPESGIFLDEAKAAIAKAEGAES